MALSYDEEQTLVTNTIAEVTAEFGDEFGLRAFPGKRFRLAPRLSHFYSEGHVQLVVQVHDPARVKPEWVDFGRDSVEELRRNIVKKS